MDRQCRNLIPFALAAFATILLAGQARAAELTLTASANPIGLGEELTVSFTPKILNLNDTVTFDFGDGTPHVEVKFAPMCGIFGGCGTVTHTYTRLGGFAIQASGTIGGESVSGSLQIHVSAGTDRYVLAAAHATGINQTVWRSDVELHNPGVGTATVEISLLERQKDNSSPAQRQVEIPTAAAVRLEDILDSQFTHSGTAALRLSPKGGSFLATSRTYNSGDGGTYGQYVPAVKVEDAVQAGKIARLIQLSHNPTLAAGYRTNVGLLNPAPTDIRLEISFYDNTGASIGSVTVDLLPYEYRQIDKAFELVTTDVIDDGYVRVRSLTPEAVFFTYASVVDNITGDPTLIPALVQ